MLFSVVVVEVFHHGDTEDSEKKKKQRRGLGDPKRSFGACVPERSLGTRRMAFFFRARR
jgi:hypothetical protein